MSIQNETVLQRTFERPPSPLDTMDYSYTEALYASVRGIEEVDRQYKLHEPTTTHKFRVGQAVFHVLEAHGLPKWICDKGALSGASHDDGKYEDEILPHVKSSDNFTPRRRKFVTDGHSVYGALGLIDAGMPDEAFTAYVHHAPEVPPNYLRMQMPFKRRWGIAHLVKVVDPADSLLDKSRLYVAKREPDLTMDKIFEIAMRARGDFNPIIHGREINIPLTLTWLLNHNYNPN